MENAEPSCICAGSNLAVWDHVKMWDPEIGNSGARYPINATWTFGLDVTF